MRAKLEVVVTVKMQMTSTRNKTKYREREEAQVLLQKKIHFSQDLLFESCISPLQQ